MFSVDVAVDKYIVATSPTEEIRKKCALTVRIGVSFGAILTFVSYLVFMGNPSIASGWNIFFLAVLIFTIPLLGIAPMLGKIEGEDYIPKTDVSVDFRNEIKTKPIILMCLFMFLSNGGWWWDWVLESWIYSTYGSSGTTLMTSVLTLTVFIIIIGAIIGYKIHDRTVSNNYREKILAFIMVIAGTLYGIGIFLDLLTFLILVLIVNFFAGMFEIFLFSMMIDLSKKKASIFQFISVFSIIARIIFVPLGLYLYVYIPAQVIILIGCSMYIISALPMLLIPRYRNKK